MQTEDVLIQLKLIFNVIRAKQRGVITKDGPQQTNKTTDLYGKEMKLRGGTSSIFQGPQHSMHTHTHTRAHVEYILTHKESNTSN